METAAESAAQQVASLVEHAEGGNDTGKTGNVDHSPIGATRIADRGELLPNRADCEISFNFSALSEFADL